MLRWVALASMSFWLGGFTFYSAVVNPMLREELGGLEAGTVTGRVSEVLNWIGVGTMASWGVLAFAERSLGGKAPRRLRIGLIVVDVLILHALITLHPVLDAKLEAGDMSRFHSLHQTYLIASTAQWVVNLALLAITVWLWRGSEDP